MMDPLWSETCWSTFKYFIILILSTYYILCISWIINSSIIIDARCKHEHDSSCFQTIPPRNTAALPVISVYFGVFLFSHIFLILILFKSVRLTGFDLLRIILPLFEWGHKYNQTFEALRRQQHDRQPCEWGICSLRRSFSLKRIIFTLNQFFNEM